MTRVAKGAKDSYSKQRVSAITTNCEHLSASPIIHEIDLIKMQMGIFRLPVSRSFPENLSACSTVSHHISLKGVLIPAKPCLMNL